MCVCVCVYVLCMYYVYVRAFVSLGIYPARGDEHIFPTMLLALRRGTFGLMYSLT